MANLETIAMLAETDGVLVVDKPIGLAAHDVMKAVKTHFNLVKVGHGGTLDANATGVFLVLLGDATRLSGDFMGRDRVFTGRIELGRTTDTGCRDGRLLETRGASEVTPERLAAAMKEMSGDVFLRAPAFNAVKLPSRTGYEIVEETGDRPEKLVHVYRFRAVRFENPFVDFELSCTAGVNVRALVRDLGAALGCGACVVEQRRVRQGAARVEDAISPIDLFKLDAVTFRNRVIGVGKALG